MKNKTLFKIVSISLIGNVILTLIKLITGMVGSSQSLIADGINSMADILVSVLMLIVLKVSTKGPDRRHPYGHEKFEGILYLLLSVIIMFTAGFIFYHGMNTLIDVLKDPTHIKTPEEYTIIIAGIAIIIKISLFMINSYFAKKYYSASLKADANNHLFDILSTSISFISIIIAQYGMIHFEPIASMVISLLIFYIGFKMIKEAISFLVDESADEKTLEKIRKIILDCQGVLSVDDLKVRKHMNHYYVDVEIGVSSSLTLNEAHLISESVHDEVEKKMDVLHCMVHVNPIS